MPSPLIRTIDRGRPFANLAAFARSQFDAPPSSSVLPCRDCRERVFLSARMSSAAEPKDDNRIDHLVIGDSYWLRIARGCVQQDAGGDLMKVTNVWTACVPCRRAETKEACLSFRNFRTSNEHSRMSVSRKPTSTSGSPAKLRQFAADFALRSQLPRSRRSATSQGSISIAASHLSRPKSCRAYWTA